MRVKVGMGSNLYRSWRDWQWKTNDTRMSRLPWGRGLKVTNSLLSNCNFGANLEWPNISDYAEGSETAQKDATGYRAFIFTNNRFHSVGVGAVRNAGPNAAKINGILATGNIMDIGRTFWTGVIKEAVISGITITQTPHRASICTTAPETIKFQM